jgi:hypothetical protein
MDAILLQRALHGGVKLVFTKPMKWKDLETSLDTHGMAVQVDPIKLVSTAPETELLKLKCD